ANEIKNEIRQYGEEPKDSGSFKGTMHRNWMTLKSTFSGNNEEAVLEEAIRGEKASLEEYDALITEKNLPPTIDAMILKHRNAIQAALNTDKLNEDIVS
ncbi:MAG: PA2169 family four-helix-bundle protein, partial [Bizionia sp.]|nr:PA2169 family four-helix-bundle protein [Bizionia sp.]